MEMNNALKEVKPSLEFHYFAGEEFPRSISIKNLQLPLDKEQSEKVIDYFYKVFHKEKDVDSIGIILRPGIINLDFINEDDIYRLEFNDFRINRFKYKDATFSFVCCKSLKDNDFRFVNLDNTNRISYKIYDKVECDF